MITKHRTKGFIFKKTDRAEVDRVYSVFTEDYGRLEVFGKAIRKINSKLKSGIDIFYFSEVEFIQGKSNRTLTGAVKLKNFNGIIKDFEKTKVAHKISNTLDVFLKGQEKDGKIFSLIDEVYSKLNDSTLSHEHCALLYYYFFWNFLSLLGYHPQVVKCAECFGVLDQEKLYFSDKDGGVICGNCFNINKNAIGVNADFVKILRLILKKDWQVLSRLRVEENLKKTIEDVSESYFKYISPDK